jgi:hypothetical protein
MVSLPANINKFSLKSQGAACAYAAEPSRIAVWGERKQDIAESSKMMSLKSVLSRQSEQKKSRHC